VKNEIHQGERRLIAKNRDQAAEAGTGARSSGGR